MNSNELIERLMVVAPPSLSGYVKELQRSLPAGSHNRMQALAHLNRRSE